MTMNLLECECDNYKELFTDLCQFIEGFGVLHDAEGKIIHFFRCGNNWFANKEEHDDECEKCDEWKCKYCNQTRKKCCRNCQCDCECELYLCNCCETTNGSVKYHEKSDQYWCNICAEQVSCENCGCWYFKENGELCDDCLANKLEDLTLEWIHIPEHFFKTRRSYWNKIDF